MAKTGRPRVSVPSVTISIRGDETVREAIRRIASRQQIWVADLVRTALDSHLGESIAAEVARIRAESGNKSHR